MFLKCLDTRNIKMFRHSKKIHHITMWLKKNNDITSIKSIQVVICLLNFCAFFFFYKNVKKNLVVCGPARKKCWNTFPNSWFYIEGLKWSLHSNLKFSNAFLSFKSLVQSLGGFLWIVMSLANMKNLGNFSWTYTSYTQNTQNSLSAMQIYTEIYCL